MRQLLFLNKVKGKVRRRIIPDESGVSFLEKITPVYSETGVMPIPPMKSVVDHLKLSGAGRWEVIELMIKIGIDVPLKETNDTD